MFTSVGISTNETQVPVDARIPRLNALFRDIFRPIIVNFKFSNYWQRLQ